MLADPGHEEHARLREWAGELPSFDRATTDLLVRQTGARSRRASGCCSTRAAADDPQTVRRLRSWFEPEDGFRGILATAAVALLSASGPIRRAELAERVYAPAG